jgi:hypothetical protein
MIDLGFDILEESCRILLESCNDLYVLREIDGFEGSRLVIKINQAWMGSTIVVLYLVVHRRVILNEEISLADAKDRVSLEFT